MSPTVNPRVEMMRAWHRWPDPHIKRSGTHPDPTRKDQNQIRILHRLNFEIQIQSGSASMQLHQ